MTIVGDAAAGLLCSQIIYWTQRGVDVLERDGWIHKTAAEWELETGMSWKVQRRARQILVALDLIEERKVGMPSQLEFRLKLSTLCALLAERTDVEIAPFDLATFRSGFGSGSDSLLGRSFLFHGVLATLFPVTTSMMCSRLLSPVGLATLDPRSLKQLAARGLVKFVALHRDRWQAETGLTRDQWQTARRNLHAAGLLHVRKRNFPRRIELALNLAALAEVLAAGRRVDGSVPSDTYRLDRAIQLGGIGNHPNQLPESPDPAFRNSPILPIAIAPSSLYQYQLQDSLHQPPLGVPGHEPEQAHQFGCSGGGGYRMGSFKVEGLKVSAAEPQVSKDGVVSIDREPLIWPPCCTSDDRSVAMRHLKDLQGATRQVVLDEVAWVSSCKPVKSPVGLIRKLARLAGAGDFLPEGAHRIAAARSAVIKGPAVASESPVQQAPFVAPTKEVRDALDATKARSKARQAQGRMDALKRTAA
jgi:hypothetical protein